MKRQSTQKGRPKSGRPPKDYGTPELQRKRQSLLESLNHQNDQPFHSAIFDGCYLQQLFCQNLITQDQLEIGLLVRKLYGLYLRSRAVKNKISTSLKRSEFYQTHEKDLFEEQMIEKKWQFILLFIQREEKNLSHRQLFLKILFNDFFEERGYSLVNLGHGFLKILRQHLDKLATLRFFLASYHSINLLH